MLFTKDCKHNVPGSLQYKYCGITDTSVGCLERSHPNIKVLPPVRDETHPSLAWWALNVSQHPPASCIQHTDAAPSRKELLLLSARDKRLLVLGVTGVYISPPVGFSVLLNTAPCVLQASKSARNGAWTLSVCYRSMCETHCGKLRVGCTVMVFSFNL